MTFNYKALTLVVLTSLAVGASAHSSRATCDCDKKEREFCRKSCCKIGIKKKNCKVKPASLAYDCCLSFEQVVFFNEATEPMRIDSRPRGEKPRGVCGRFKICCAPDRSEAQYELEITGLNLVKFPNQRPIGAGLYFGTATNIVGVVPAIDDNLIARLCGLDNDGTDPTNCETPNSTITTKNGVFCCKDTLTNEQLRKVVLKTAAMEDATIPTIGALCEAIRAGKVFIVINGGQCDTDDTAPKYGVDLGGMLRCQISGEEVAGVTTDGGGT